MTLEERIIAAVAGALEGKHEVTLAADLRKDLKVDSFGTIMIINALEDEFSIAINETKFESVMTVGDIAALLRKHHPNLEESAGG